MDRLAFTGPIDEQRFEETGIEPDAVARGHAGQDRNDFAREAGISAATASV